MNAEPIRLRMADDGAHVEDQDGRIVEGVYEVTRKCARGGEDKGRWLTIVIDEGAYDPRVREQAKGDMKT